MSSETADMTGVPGSGRRSRPRSGQTAQLSSRSTRRGTSSTRQPVKSSIRIRQLAGEPSQQDRRALAHPAPPPPAPGFGGEPGCGVAGVFFRRAFQAAGMRCLRALDQPRRASGVPPPGRSRSAAGRRCRRQCGGLRLAMNSRLVHDPGEGRICPVLLAAWPTTCGKPAAKPVGNPAREDRR
jgi:hypothetical protein